VIASVLVVQCLFFADGGLLALGCNIFNLGFWPAFVGLALYRRVLGDGTNLGRVTWAAVVALVVSLELGALSVVFQTLLSGRSDLPFDQFGPVMLGIHLPIAVVEGLVTAGVVQFIRRLMPERVEWAPRRSHVAALTTVLGCTLLIGIVGVWFASSRPDGLEWSISRITGQEELASSHSQLAALQERTALMPDYEFPSHEESSTEQWPAVSAGTSTAGLIGASVVAVVIFLVGWILRLTRRHKHGATA
jgi:cobalt/nickel transport system permease protein